MSAAVKRQKPLTKERTMKKNERKSIPVISTARGEHLRKAHDRTQGGMREKCKECGCKIRGKNHDNGTHHKNKVKMKTD